ncbi:hypothetical protein BSKO_03217 [Bryopsis sp. KO-2023]|nr:hypothetical protein BSKO_03217 [Bryopsis sp. KO-2023]
MKLTSIGILRWNGDQEPILLGMAQDLSSFGYFQRTSVKEMITFVSRTIVRRTQLGQRQTVQHEDYYCHVHVRESGLAGIAVADKDYPARAAFSVVATVLDEYLEKNGESFRNVTADSTLGDDIAEPALVKYQDPINADKIMKIQKDLDETKIVLHQTIESVLERGEKLDNLVGKSNDLSIASQMFYKQAKKTNACCRYM